MDFRKAILDVICQDAKLIAPFLGAPAMRTHAFLGSGRRVPPGSRKFSKHGNGGFHSCILTQVYKRYYPHMASAAAPPQISEPSPWYEFYRFDCAYFAARRISNAVGFPVVWEMAWMIEVENDPRKFAFILRALLDIVCNARLAIFFVNFSPDREQQRLTDEFRVSWDAFEARHRFASELALQVIFFPDSYSSFQTFATESRYWIWEPASRSFRSIP